MYAVFRETNYEADRSITESPEFESFQRLHAERQGYRGTVVAEVGGGRLLTLTLWDTVEDMEAARRALGPIVQRVLAPLMTEPSTLLGTGRVVVNDLVEEGEGERTP